MTADDYIKWAEDYRRDAAEVERQLNEKKEKCRSEIGNAEGTRLEKLILFLFEQKVQLNSIAKELEERAEIIRERESKIQCLNK